MLKRIIRNRVVILIVLALLTIGVTLFAFRLRIDASLTSVLPADDPNFQYNQKIEEQFGSTEEIVVLVTSDQSIFTAKTLAGIEEITQTLRSIEGVLSEQAVSITTIAAQLPGREDIEFSPDMPREAVEKVRSAIQENPLFAGKIVSEDGRVTLITAPVSVDISYSDTRLKALVDTLRERIETVRGNYPSLSIELSGHPIIQADIMRYMANDLLKLFPIAIIVVMVILLAALRSVRGMFIPIIVTLVSIAWTFGLKGIIGSPITITETVIPVILISLGCANGIHILTEFLHFSNRGNPPFLAVKRTMKQLTVPVILTSITTSLGFSSLVFSSGQSLKNMGLFLAFGVLIAMGFSLLFIPIILSRLRISTRHKPEKQEKAFHRLRFFEHVTEFLLKYKLIILLIVAVMLTLSVLGIVKMDADTDEVRYFKESTPIRQVTEKIEETMGGISTLYIVLESGQDERFKQPDALFALEAIQKAAEKNDNVGYTMSLTDYIKTFYYTLRGGDEQYFVLPENEMFLQRLVSMIATNEEVSAGMLDNYVDPSFSTVCLHVRLKDSNTAELKKLVEELEPVIAEELPENIEARFAGDYIRLINGENIVRSQIISLIVTLATILVVLSVMFRSPIIGGLVATPVTIAVLFNFAVMWLTDISLNPATAIIASVGLGVGVDYAIHYFHRFRSHYLRSGKYRQSIVSAVVESAKGILSNAVAVGIGFLVLLFSAYRIIMDMGWIIALSMITTAVLSLTVLPVLIGFGGVKVPRNILFFKSEGEKE